MRKILWNRKLSCGHERETSIAYQFADYEKPEVGSHCYCRVCFQEVSIIKVEEVE